MTILKYHGWLLRQISLQIMYYLYLISSGTKKNERRLWQRNLSRVKLGLVRKIGLNCSYLTETWIPYGIFICPFIIILEQWHVHIMHIAFRWLLLPIDQVCFQEWSRSYLAVHFGFFEIRTFAWSPSKVEVSTFYPFTLKVGSMYT